MRTRNKKKHKLYAVDGDILLSHINEYAAPSNINFINVAFANRHEFFSSFLLLFSKSYRKGRILATIYSICRDKREILQSVQLDSIYAYRRSNACERCLFVRPSHISGCGVCQLNEIIPHSPNTCWIATKHCLHSSTTCLISLPRLWYHFAAPLNTCETAHQLNSSSESKFGW